MNLSNLFQRWNEIYDDVEKYDKKLSFLNALIGKLLGTCDWTISTRPCTFGTITIYFLHENKLKMILVLTEICTDCFLLKKQDKSCYGNFKEWPAL